MQKRILALIAGASVIASASVAEAMPVVSFSEKGSNPNILTVQMYTYNGQNYCWYNGGWNGPGYYWCGYAWYPGYGWGGPWGWLGWQWGHHGHPPPGWHPGPGGWHPGPGGGPPG